MASGLKEHSKISPMDYVEETLEESHEAVERKKKILTNLQSQKPRIFLLYANVPTVTHVNTEYARM